MRSIGVLVRRVIGLAVALSALGCASSGPPSVSNSAEGMLAASSEKVRAAVIDVLTANGYAVREEAKDHRILTTGYREEIAGPWDWLLRSRFGVGRSLVVAMVTSEDDTATRLSIQVTYEGKNHIWDSWSEEAPPLPLSAENNLRLIKNALGLL